jgi:hypothetical protein
MTAAPTPWRARAGRTGGWLLLGGCVLATAAMLVVMLVLSFVTARSVLASAGNVVLPVATAVAAQAPSASGAAGLANRNAAGNEGNNDLVTNAMTAIGTAVAAVTLLLSFGSTWFAEKLNEVDKLAVRLEALRAEHEQSDQQRRECDRVREHLVAAEIALRRWIDSSATAATRYSLLADLQAHLAALMSAELEERFVSYNELIKFLPLSSEPDLGPMQRYAEACHRLHGGTESTLWCLLFSEIEQAAAARKLRNFQYDFV